MKIRKIFVAGTAALMLALTGLTAKRPANADTIAGQPTAAVEKNKDSQALQNFRQQQKRHYQSYQNKLNQKVKAKQAANARQLKKARQSGLSKAALRRQAKKQYRSQQAKVKRDYARLQRQATAKYRRAYKNAPIRPYKTAVGEMDRNLDLNDANYASIRLTNLPTTDSLRGTMYGFSKRAFVRNEAQLPTDFKPGLLVYDAANDHSGRISKKGLTQAQKNRLDDLSTLWMNSLRQQFYTNPKLFRSMKSLNSSNSSFVTSFGNELGSSIDYSQHKLYTTDLARKWAQHVADYRQSKKARYVHTVSKNKLRNYYDLIDDVAGNKVNGTSAENLFQLDASQQTFLQYEVCLYNRMQSMLWGEYYHRDADGSFGGHLDNALNPNVSTVAMAFQDLRKNHHVMGDNADYYILWEFAGYKDSSRNIYPAGNVITSNIAAQIAAARQKGGPDYSATSVVNPLKALAAIPGKKRAALARAKRSYQRQLRQIKHHRRRYVNIGRLKRKQARQVAKLKAKNRKLLAAYKKRQAKNYAKYRTELTAAIKAKASR